MDVNPFIVLIRATIVFVIIMLFILFHYDIKITRRYIDWDRDFLWFVVLLAVIIVITLLFSI